MAGDKPWIQPLKNGPLRVGNMKRIVAEDGTILPDQDDILLCRCGHSKNKPYCDGTHAEVGFSSDKQDGRLPDRVKDYTGERITIHDNRGVCSHAEYCVRESPEVFQFDARPWIRPDADAPEKTALTIEKCPSGALSYTRDGVLHKDLERSPSMYIAKNGPYDVVGSPELRDPDGNVPESGEHYALCRCGRSKNKPFCDGAHRLAEERPQA
jgi:CDGSH-type Zn-finger protein